MAEFKIEGVDEIIKSFDNIENFGNVEQVLGKACAMVEKEAIQNAPKDRGDLKRSIKSEVNGTEGVIFSNLEYAPYVEFGTGIFAEGGNGRQSAWSYQDEQGEWHRTSGNEPQPFLRPAFDKCSDKIMKLFEEELFNG